MRVTHPAIFALLIRDIVHSSRSTMITDFIVKFASHIGYLPFVWRQESAHTGVSIHITFIMYHKEIVDPLTRAMVLLNQ